MSDRTSAQIAELHPEAGNLTEPQAPDLSTEFCRRTLYEGLLRVVIRDADYFRIHESAADLGVSAIEHWKVAGRYSGRPPTPLIQNREWREVLARSPDYPLLEWNRTNGHGFPLEADGGEAYRLLDVLAPYLRDSLPDEWGHVDVTRVHTESFCRALDPVFYGLRYGDLPIHYGLRLRHYLRFGWIEGRHFAEGGSPQKVIDAVRSGRIPYGNLVAGVSDAVGPATNISAQRIARISESVRADLTEAQLDILLRCFDPDIYGMSLGLQPGTHRDVAIFEYLRGGWRIMPDTRCGFDSDSYLNQFPEVREANISPLKHFVKFGVAENRLPHLSPQKDATPKSRREESAGDTLSDRFSKTQIDLLLKLLDLEAYAVASGMDNATERVLLESYLDGGWRDFPNRGHRFDSDYYLDRYPDLRGAPISPVEHYVRHGRAEMRQPVSFPKSRLADFAPLVSVIVPNYNHARFLPERLESIARQTYANIEVILLDDASSDNSVEVLADWAEAGHDFPVRKKFNLSNAGNVFRQWQRGIEMARGELVWICESDDFCDERFLETLVPYFAIPSNNLAFGRIEFVDETGKTFDGMSGFREYSEAGIWDTPVTRPAKAWFEGAWGVNNIVANVGGCVFRKRELSAEVYREAQSYRIAGDWFLYTHLVGSGQMSFDPGAVAYFRQHTSNTSASNFGKLYYYEELARIRRHNRQLWSTPDAVDAKFLDQVRAQWKHFGMDGDLKARVPLIDAGIEREAMHVLIAYLGPYMGGGEWIATQIANAIAALSSVERPIFVSLFAYNLHDGEPILEKAISPAVTLYSVDDTLGGTPSEFLQRVGADVVNSHMSLLDHYFLHLNPDPIDIPYVVTLHGSHQGDTDLENSFLLSILKGVDMWLYTAPQNLGLFRGIDIASSRIKQIANAMPPDPEEPPFDREALGISEEAVVFTLVARGIERKGWKAAIHAFLALRERRPNADMHLLLVGDGDRVAPLREEHGDDGRIHFLGYQKAINGIYRLSDCALLPTRFQGESYPLCLIQALMEGVPAIVTDVGYLSEMITVESGEQAGLVVPAVRDTSQLIASTSEAMKTMLDGEFRAAKAALAEQAGKAYAIDKLARTYIDLFDDLRQS